MVFDTAFLDELTERAKTAPRLRMNYDLRDTAEDQSQRMLNAIEPETVMAIHRHKTTSEIVICIRGHFEQYLYDDDGHLIETIDMIPGGNTVVVPAGQWHSLKSLESGTVLFECKNGPWKPIAPEDIIVV